MIVYDYKVMIRMVIKIIMMMIMMYIESGYANYSHSRVMLAIFHFDTITINV